MLCFKKNVALRLLYSIIAPVLSRIAKKTEIIL